MKKITFEAMGNRMKQVLFTIIFLISAPAIAAQTAQQFCDSLANNAHNMFNDVNSQEYAAGAVSNNDLYANYAAQNEFVLIIIQRQILDQIIANRGKVSAQDVNNYVYGRCENDYRQYQANYN